MEHIRTQEQREFDQNAFKIFGSDNLELLEQYLEAPEMGDLNAVVESFANHLAPTLSIYFGSTTQILARIKSVFDTVNSFWKLNIRKSETELSDKTSALIDFRNNLLDKLAKIIKDILHETCKGHVYDTAANYIDLVIADPYATNINVPNTNNQKANLFYTHRAGACLNQHGESLADSLKTYEAEYDDDPNDLLDLVQDLVKKRKVSFGQHQIGNAKLVISGDEHPGARRLRKKRICTIEIVPDVTATEGVKSFTLNLDRETGELHLGSAGSVPFSNVATLEMNDKIRGIVLSLLADDLEVQPDETDIEDEEPEFQPSEPAAIVAETEKQVKDVSKDKKKPKKRRVDRNKDSYNVIGLQLKRVRRMLAHILGSDSLVRRNGHDIYEVPNGGKLALPKHGRAAVPFLGWVKRAGMATKKFIKN